MSELPLDVLALPLLLQPLTLASAAILVLSALVLWLRHRPTAVNGTSTTGRAKEAVKAPKQRADVTEDKGPPKRRSVLLYGTQTGTAERFAKQLKGELQIRYDDTAFEVMDTEEYKAEQQLPQESLVFLLLATYGDGEPTDNAAEFYNWLIKASQDGEQACLLKGTNFAVFGLGNRQYEHYCAVGAKVHKAMLALGASAVVANGEGDDDDDIEADFDKWRALLYESLDSSLLVSKAKQAPTTAQISVADSVACYDVQLLTGSQADQVCSREQTSRPELPAPLGATQGVSFCPVLCNRELHSQQSDRSCLHVELSLEGTGLSYETGDHMGLLPCNDPALVEEAADLLGVPSSTVFSLSVPQGNPGDLKPAFAGPISLARALSCHVDLLSPITRTGLQAFAACTQGEEQKRLLHLLSPEGAAQHRDWHKQSRCLLELMQEFPSAHPPLGAFFGAIAPRLQTRFYSISSSPLAHPSAVHVTCAYVAETTATGRRHVGVCSQFLKALRPGSHVPLFIRRSTFRLPKEVISPVVMVGPGTGLAPFLGFLQHLSALRAQGKQLGPVRLYFGCRHQAQDFIYRSELEAWRQQGTLQALSTAFSRDGPQKDYVQMHMRRDGAELAQLLGRQQGHLYVCGDAKHMAKDVHAALLTLMQQHLGHDAQAAESAIQRMAEQGRYQKDVW